MATFLLLTKLVYWLYPLTQQFLQQHPRWNSVPARLVEYSGELAIYFQIADMESNNSLTVLAYRQTLQVLTCF